MLLCVFSRRLGYLKEANQFLQGKLKSVRPGSPQERTLNRYLEGIGAYSSTLFRSLPKKTVPEHIKRSGRLRLRLDGDGFEAARTKLSRGAHDPKLWEESFREDELEPPSMIPTPILGKLLSRGTRKGVPDALIGVLTFFPPQGNPSGPVVPVLTELMTDGLGRFEGEVPIPDVAPQVYPVLAITATENDRRTLSATPVAAVRPGEKNQLGVFWSASLPSLLRCYSGRGGGALRVVVTGALDPHRWHPGVRDATFGYFPSVLIPSADSSGQTGGTTPQTARMSLGPLSGRHRVSLVWNNDKFIRGQLDANIRVVSPEFVERPILSTK